MGEGESRLPLVVLISGNGSNLQAIIDAARQGLPVDIRAVISNRADAYGLERARAAGIPAEIVESKTFATREDFERTLRERIDAHQPALLVLAGFMRILTSGFVQHYQGRMLNIHPSLLPELRGLRTHARALEAGARRHGASVHFVTDELDGGPVVIQASVPVRPDDDEQRLATRVLEQEHRIYPMAIRWYAEGRLRLQKGVAQLDGKPMAGPYRIDNERIDQVCD